MNDIDKATNAKFQVEQKQRVEARERKENSGEWENRVSVVSYTLPDLFLKSSCFTVFQISW